MSLAVVLVKGTCSISSHVCLSNQNDNLVLSHCPVSISTNSFTFFSQGPSLQKHGGQDNHLWVAMSSDEPLPTFHVDLSKSTSRAWSKLLHTYDGLLPNLASKKEISGKYLVLYTLKNREFCRWTSLHACLASMAKLKVLMSLKPHSTFLLCLAQPPPVYPVYLILIACLTPPVSSDDGVDIIT